MLPVFMDLQGEKEIPKMAMVMVIDHSGSMTTPSSDNSNVTGLDLAKEAAVSGVENLRKTDEVGVLVFDDGFQWTVPIEEADDIDSILKTLKDNNVKITFFMVGDWVDKFPEAVKKISLS